MLLTDRDLLVIEPSVFVDAAAGATVLLAGTDGAVSGTALESAGSDFAAAEIGADHVAVINGAAIEIVARVSSTQLDVSLPRAAESDPKIAPGDGTSLAFEIRSFTRLIAQVQQAVLLGVGVDPEHPARPLTASAVCNPVAAGVMLALRTIAEAFATAAALNPADASLAARAALYARRAAGAMRATPWPIDLDGDGQPDATRWLDVTTFTRA